MQGQNKSYSVFEVERPLLMADATMRELKSCQGEIKSGQGEVKSGQGESNNSPGETSSLLLATKGAAEALPEPNEVAVDLWPHGQEDSIALLGSGPPQQPLEGATSANAKEAGIDSHSIAVDADCVGIQEAN
jgi:hypothetical protein